MRRVVALPAAAGFVLTANTFLSPGALAQGTPAGAAAAPAQITEEKVISGTMDIEFGTRTNLDTSGDLKDGSPAIGAKDTYRFDLTVAKTTQFTGTIHRQPNLYTRTLARRKQDALLTYSADLAVLKPDDPKQKKVIGKWVGTVPIDTATGAYDLGGGRNGESKLRIAVDTVGRMTGFTDLFGGKLVGKAEKKDNLAQYTFKRIIGDKTVQIVVKKSDPMSFQNIVLAKGPSENYPRTSVSGRLDYDYETGNWYTSGIHFAYNLDGKDFEDVVTGSIKWVEDPERKTNGKGYYEFNLRFNEEKYKKAPGEAAAFEKMSDEDAFFAVDNTIPCLTGRISYVDTMGGSPDAPPTASKITYDLDANKLTKQQIMNFYKLWMICVGPTNDE
jgi:hypothetical protein